jgi:putative serine protease PepD
MRNLIGRASSSAGVVRLSCVLAIAAACAIAGCGGDRVKPSSSPAGAPVALQSAFVRVVHDVSPSVVQIQTSRGLGSGVVFDDARDIVTNAHVVADAQSFRGTLAAGERVQASLVGRWTPGDLAVIRARSGDLRPAAFADSSTLEVGEIVMAIGNPLGLRSSVTQGIVSSLGRTVSEGANGVMLPAAIQTSAAINPGNSGGALVNLDGDVVGVPTLAATDPELGGGQAPGIGFAIPSSTVSSIAHQLIESGHVTRSGRAELGVRAATVTGGGVAIVGVTGGGPADRAGLGRGDIIVALDGKPTPDVNALSSVLAGLKPGARVNVTIRGADGTRDQRRVTLGQLEG